MYSRSFSTQSENYNSTAQERHDSNIVPPDYGGITYDGRNGEAKTFYESSKSTEQSYDRHHRGVPAEKAGNMSQRLTPEYGATKGIGKEELLLCALIITLLTNGADDDIILLLGFLLIVGL